jgi:hypothetical protein
MGGLFLAQDGEILSCKIGMAAFQRPSSMGRSGSTELYQERRAAKEAPSSRGRKVLVSESMYFLLQCMFFCMCLDGACNQFCKGRQSCLLDNGNQMSHGENSKFLTRTWETGSGRRWEWSVWYLLSIRFRPWSARLLHS